MERITLKAQPRKAETKIEDLLAEMIIPAVIYGGERKEALSLQVERAELLKTLKVANASTLLNIEIEGKNSPALIGEIQRHPITDEIIHLDFRQVDMKKPVKTWLNLVFTGESQAVKVLGGLFVTNRDKIQVLALPEALVDSIEVDISVIKDFEHGIHISDITLPEGIHLLDEATASVAIVRKPKTQAEVDADLAEPVGDEPVAGTEDSASEEGEAGDKKEEGKQKKEGEKK